MYGLHRLIKYADVGHVVIARELQWLFHVSHDAFSTLSVCVVDADEKRNDDDDDHFFQPSKTASATVMQLEVSIAARNKV